MKEVHLRDVIALLASVMFIIVVGCDTRPKSKRQGYRTECVYNLKGLYMDYGVFVQDHGAFVAEVSTNSGGTMEYRNDPTKAYLHFQAFATSGGPFYILTCPKDTREPARTRTLANKNLSYFVTLNVQRDPDPGWILMGTRNISSRTEVIVELGADPNVGWDARAGLHQNLGALLSADGSIREIDSNQLKEVAHNTGNRTNRLIIP